jgi:hypothetical protein
LAGGNSSSTKVGGRPEYAVNGCRRGGDGGIVGAMPRTDSTPHLLASLPPSAQAPECAAPRRNAEPDKPGTPTKPLLPKDLAGALTRLTDAEVDFLLAAVTAESKRRGRLTPTPRSGMPPDVGPRPRRVSASEDSAGSLTTGQLNAVRAAFKAGVKPSAIARQFGISQSDVRKALMVERG